METKPVLIIDDDEISQMVLSVQLEKIVNTDDIIIKDDGAKALLFLDNILAHQKEKPCLIFLDLNMPQVSGYDFIKIYEEVYAPLLPNAQLMILTSSVRKKDQEMAKHYHSVKGYYKKPLEEFQLKEIMTIVESV
ncbi:CheY-like chemotaxis protein [Catalinimonas alkaloidigena]|uniref:response regulator n=1 Tax=Catalinimonas alkaloidigena TaxID=1075417 RepID=UPI002406A10D|nr:response regulator [Catalinimonas alkaloidigena]MDF9797162.1 CheY-like chemotaxis protein [Catalinimonas alkaloidigena]